MRVDVIDVLVLHVEVLDIEVLLLEVLLADLLEKLALVRDVLEGLVLVLLADMLQVEHAVVLVVCSGQASSACARNACWCAYWCTCFCLWRRWLRKRWKVLALVKGMLEVPLLVLLADVLEVETRRCAGNGSDCAWTACAGLIADCQAGTCLVSRGRAAFVPCGL